MKDSTKIFWIMVLLLAGLMIQGCNTPTEPRGIQSTWEYTDTTGAQP